MPFRLYIVPVVGAGTFSDPRRPKYFQSDLAGAGRIGIVTTSWSGMDYGFEPWMVVGADLVSADDALIVAQPDGMAIPTMLDAVLNVAQVTIVRNKLEAINVPAGWVTTALTWRTVVRVVLGMFLILQRYAAVHGTVRLFAGGVALDSTVNSLPASARLDFSSAAQSLGLSTVAITGAMTIRAALQTLADQLSDRTFTFNGAVI